MSTAVLQGLLNYLYGTLTPSSMRWVGEQLIEHARKEEPTLKPYTMEEIDAILDEAERDFEAGDYMVHEEVFHHKEAITA